MPDGQNPKWQPTLDRIRELARDCGYAVAVHGSTTRDLDLIAAPWTAEAVSADQFVATLCDVIPLHAQAVNVYPNGDIAPNPEPKAWGRWGWSLFGCPGVQYVDLSVVPRAGEPVPLLTFETVRNIDAEWRGDCA